MSQATQKATSIAEKTEVKQLPKEEQATMSTWAIIGVLIIAFFVLKSFIYIKDGDRHGK